MWVGLYGSFIRRSSVSVSLQVSDEQLAIGRGPIAGSCRRWHCRHGHNCGSDSGLTNCQGGSFSQLSDHLRSCNLKFQRLEYVAVPKLSQIKTIKQQARVQRTGMYRRNQSSLSFWWLLIYFFRNGHLKVYQSARRSSKSYK